MKLLILGGTRFLGRHFVEIALKKGYEVTLFNRGKANPSLFPQAKKLIGDRKSDFRQITDNFDVILDTSGFFPKNLEYITSYLKGHAGYYVFVSSCSVYDYDYEGARSFDENGQLVDLDIDENDETPDTYGARKYLCEKIVRDRFQENHLILRPGLIVGPHDPTYRFPYWADRFSEGGMVLAPGEPSAPLQFIDARDLSDWILSCIEKKVTGTFNTVSPEGRLTLKDFLETTKSIVNQDCEIKWVNEQFLKDKGIDCWSQLPLWIYKEVQRFLRVDSTKAISHGLKYRSIEDTIKDTHEWSKPIYKEQFLEKVLSREKERQLLAEYGNL